MGDNRYANYLPTQEEIAQGCKEIQKTWSLKEFYLRSGNMIHFRQWMLGDEASRRCDGFYYENQYSNSEEYAVPEIPVESIPGLQITDRAFH